MPIYEYRCRKCGHKFELIRKLSDVDSAAKCPRCAAENPERLVSTFGSGGSKDTCGITRPT